MTNNLNDVGIVWQALCLSWQPQGIAVMVARKHQI
jgi:hypothetical protein